MSETELWYAKYRPVELDDYIWSSPTQEANVKEWLDNPASLPHLFLHGSPGSGKTTLARLIGSKVTDESDVMFISASVTNSVADVRSTVVDFSENGGWGNIKVVILDEAERLSQAAQEALRNIIDTYGDDVRFLFTCNDFRRIIPALKSRARDFKVQDLNQDAFTERLLSIAMDETLLEWELSGDEPELQIIAEIVESTYPDMRKAIDTLQHQTIDKKLQPVAISKASQKSWTDDLMVHCMGNGSVVDLREFIANLGAKEIEDVYVVLYEEDEVFNGFEEDIIPVIAEHLYRHSLVAFPEINLADCILKIRKICHEHFEE